MPSPYILSIDQGTTSSRAVVYDAKAHAVATASQEFPQYYPRPGWVEHDANEIWQSVRRVVPEALQRAGIDGRDIAAIGITNQRETTVLWERESSKPVARALVWQDRRTTDFCRERHNDQGWISERTGLVLDPYFSATKIHWLLEQAPERRSAAAAGRLACGTIDSFLIWRLTGSQLHATDRTNASRTLLYNVHSLAWDPDLCEYFSVPAALLPEVRPSAASFGATAGLDFLPDGIPIAGVAGDQQASLFGQGGFASGSAKCTYGTGAFFLLHTGEQAVRSQSGLLSSVAASIGAKPQYVLEGSVFIAGSAVQWLRDGLKIVETAPAVEALAARSQPDEALILVPALVGLGAPYWVPEARGVLFGITRGTTAAELARATLEGVAFQVSDLIEAARADSRNELSSLRVDGGMAANDWFLQFQADVLGIPVQRAAHAESTALGAAFLAGLQIGVWPDLDTVRGLAGVAAEFSPRWAENERQRRRALWKRAVEAVISVYQPAGS